MGREFSVEDALDDYFQVIIRDDPTIVTDALQLQSEARDSRPITSHRTPIGMRREGTMRQMGSIPLDLWRADEALRPNLKPEERARDLLRRYPVLSIEGAGA
jgi:hypothetical protein